MPKHYEDKARMEAVIRHSTPGTRDHGIKMETRKAVAKGTRGAEGAYMDLFQKEEATAKRESAKRLGSMVSKTTDKRKK